jgi:collagenase-like PrtC family protease
VAVIMAHAVKLTMGPCLFNWPAERWRDFHFRLADEGAVEAVCLGEVVCSKRAPFFLPHLPEVIERLERSGIEVSVATLAEVMSRADRRLVAEVAAMEGVLIEANDASALGLLAGRPFAAGPFLNVYNEDTLGLLAGKGAVRFSLPPELPGAAVAILAAAARQQGAEVEVQVWGRLPLALSARCYHARAHGLTKDGCQFVCERDPDGMTLETLTGEPLLAVNGIQTLSHAVLNLVHDVDRLVKAGVARLRLSPHSHDMIAVAKLFRSVADHRIAAGEAGRKLAAIAGGVPFCNGFLHRAPGIGWLEAGA